MKKSSVLCCSVLTLAVLACGTTGTTGTTVTNIPTAWKNPAYSGPGFARIFVIAVGADDATRRLFEDHLAQRARQAPEWSRSPATPTSRTPAAIPRPPSRRPWPAATSTA